MKRIVCACFFMLLFAACSDNKIDSDPVECNPEEEDCSEPAPCEGCEPGPGPGGNDKLYVQGRKLMKNGQPIVLRGMSLYWFGGPWQGNQLDKPEGHDRPGSAESLTFYKESTVQALASDWGATVVRAAIGNVAENTNTAIAMAKNMMDWAKKYNIYVSIDNHTHYAHRSGPAEAANNFFREVSAYVKQKGYTHVIYEIYNEPHCDNDQKTNISCGTNEWTSWPQIKTYSERVISTIRGNDPDGVILVGTYNYSIYLQPSMDNPIAGSNLMYVFHYYGSESGHNTYKQYSLKVAYCADFPVFISEWGMSPANGRGAIDEANNNDWMSIVERSGFSWANWSLSNAGESSAALTTTDVTGATTQSGTIVKRWIKDLNAGRSTSGVNPGAVDMGCP